MILGVSGQFDGWILGRREKKRNINLSVIIMDFNKYFVGTRPAA